jgi:hypothetical protein
MQQTLQLTFAWKDYFAGSPQTTLYRQKFTSQQAPSVSSVYVSDCLFIGFKSNTRGGALRCESMMYLLVESSSFFSCNTSAQIGGTIFFETFDNGECVLHKVCGYNCCTTRVGTNSWGQFVYVVGGKSASSKNYLNYSSISRCVNENSMSYAPLRLDNGKICFPSVNVSNNKCSYYSVIYSFPVQDSNSVTCSFTYSSFVDNNATEYICLYFLTGNAKYEIKYCNILRNTQVSNTRGIIYTNGNLTIEDSCILENKANYIFYASSPYIITLSNCTVDSLSNSNGLMIQSIITKSFIHALNHMSTQNCHAEYDSVLTKNENCYTCKNIHYQVRLCNFFISTWVIIFTFIHPDPSYSDC